MFLASVAAGAGVGMEAGVGVMPPACGELPGGGQEPAGCWLNHPGRSPDRDSAMSHDNPNLVELPSTLCEQDNGSSPLARSCNLVDSACTKQGAIGGKS